MNFSQSAGDLRTHRYRGIRRHVADRFGLDLHRHVGFDCLRDQHGNAWTFSLQCRCVNTRRSKTTATIASIIAAPAGVENIFFH